jgi:hypothetical protein
VNTTSTARWINFFFSFAEISRNEFKDFAATGAFDEEVVKWIEQKASRGRESKSVNGKTTGAIGDSRRCPMKSKSSMEDYIPGVYTLRRKLIAIRRRVTQLPLLSAAASLASCAEPFKAAWICVPLSPATLPRTVWADAQ